MNRIPFFRLVMSCALVAIVGCSDDDGGTGPSTSSADLSLTKTVSDTGPDAGSQVTYTITVCNDGPSAATGITVVDELPAGLSYVSHTGAGQFDALTGVWTIGTLAAGTACSESAVLELVVAVDAGVGAGTSLTNRARVLTSGVDDPDSTPGNDDAGEDDQDEITIMVGGVENDGGFVDEFALVNWNDAGITDGTTSLTHPTGFTSVAAFAYDVNLGNPGAGVTQRTATFEMISPITGTIRFDWEYTGFHAFFVARADFIAFSDVQEVVELSGESVSGNFTFTGTTVINVVEGGSFGFDIGGRNGDSNSRLLGTLTVTALEVVEDAAVGFYGGWSVDNWSSSGITGGTTSFDPQSGATNELLVGYDVNLGNPGPGVTARFATFEVEAPTSGTVTFDWEYTGFHAFSAANARLSFLAGGTTSEEVNTSTFDSFSFSGTTSLAVTAGQVFAVEVGGDNFDSNSRLAGSVRLSNFRLDP